MRTTITISSTLRQKLIGEAAKRNLKGYSLIISEALEEYFSKEERDNLDSLRELRGCMTHEEFLEAMETVEEGRANWRM